MKPDSSTTTMLLISADDSFIMRLSNHLGQLKYKLAYIASTGEKAWRVFTDIMPQILFLDTDQDIEEVQPYVQRMHAKKEDLIIICFWNNDLVYKAYRLMKPNSFLRKDFEQLNLKQAITLSLLQVEGTPTTPKEIDNTKKLQLFIKIGDTFKSLRANEIIYFYAEKGVVYALTKERKYPTKTLKTLEQMYTSNFARIHKKYLINLDYLEGIDPINNTANINGIDIPIGYAYRKKLFQRINMVK
jgi:DNA-binding LytR/AlgR family response regulator